MENVYLKSYMKVRGNMNTKIDNLNKAIKDNKSIDKKINMFNSPVAGVVKNMISNIPLIGSFLTESTHRMLIKRQQEKREHLIKMILSDETYTTSEKVNSVEFIIDLIKTVEVVDRLTTNDKIEYFANLIKCTYLNDGKLEVKDFDSYFDLIKRMSYASISKLVEMITEFQNDSKKSKLNEKYYHNEECGFLE